jgi:hypothetical protein
LKTHLTFCYVNEGKYPLALNSPILHAVLLLSAERMS